jgi:hypothetical protein
VKRLLSMIGVSAAAAVILCGCSSPGRFVEAEPLGDVGPCASFVGETIDVEQLQTESPVTCELGHVLLRFPDGEIIDWGEVSGTGSFDPGDGRIYSYGEFGIHGVAVSSELPGEERLWWGTPEAILRLKYLENLVDSYE